MDVMFTAHPKDGSGKYYMVVAEAGEWEQILSDLHSGDLNYASTATVEFTKGLMSWGIGDE